MTNEVLNISTNAVVTGGASSITSADWWFLVLCAAFAGLTFVLMYLGRPKDNDKSDYEGEEY